MSAVGPQEALLDFSSFDDIPLFMRKLPADEKGHLKNNAALDALQTLVYEDGAEETAANLKEQANAQYSARRFKEASGFYTQAIDQLGEQLSQTTRRNLYCNRAACNLELQNYGFCIRDCASVLSEPLQAEADEEASTQFTSTTKKALFRSAKALKALRKYEESLDVLERLKAMLDKPDPSAEALLKEIQGKIAEREKAEEERKAKQSAELTEGVVLIQRLKDLQISIPHDWSYKKARTLAPGDFNPPHFYSYPDSLQVLFPIFLLRPYNQPPLRDFVPEWADDTTLSEQLEELIAQDPSFSAMDFFTITKRGRILKVGRKLTLAQVCGMAEKDGDGMELTGGWCFELYALPKDRAKEWADEMKVDLKKRGLMG